MVQGFAELTTLVAGALWTNTMPANLRRFLPFLSEEERMKLYGDIPAVLSYPRGHPVREGVILGKLMQRLRQQY